MTLQSKSTILVTAILESTGFVDKNLLNHITNQATSELQLMFENGSATPAGASNKNYDKTDIELVSVDTRQVAFPANLKGRDDSSVVLAALKHFQRDLTNGTDLTYLSDIVNHVAVSEDYIEALCESITFEEPISARGIPIYKMSAVASLAR